MPVTPPDALVEELWQVARGLFMPDHPWFKGIVEHRWTREQIILGESDGVTKIVAVGKEQRIVGVHIVGPQASELIAEATLAMRLEATTDDVIATIHAHPTLAETFREAALVARGRPIHTAR